jgi:Icc-related predicted phosphoesterase
MKILTISDEVAKAIYNSEMRDRFKEVAMVLSCGDLPFYYLEFIVSMLNVPLYYVLGNHDRPTQGEEGEKRVFPEGCINIDNRVALQNGLLIAGLEGSIKYSGGEHQYTEWEMNLKILRLGQKLWKNKVRYGRYLDILITHAPPHQIHDQEDPCHRGFKSLVKFMDKYRPRYLVHGHTHIYSPWQARRTQYKDTLVINTYGYQILEV